MTCIFHDLLIESTFIKNKPIEMQVGDRDFPEWFNAALSEISLYGKVRVLVPMKNALYQHHKIEVQTEQKYLEYKLILNKIFR